MCLSALSAAGYSCHTAAGFEEAYRLMAWEQIDIVFANQTGKTKDFLLSIKQFHKAAPFCLAVGLAEGLSGSEVLDLIDAGLENIVEKPFTQEQLVSRADDLTQQLSLGAGPLCNSSTVPLLHKLSETISCLELEPLRGMSFELIIEIFKAERACCCYFAESFSDIAATYSKEFSPKQEEAFSLFLKQLAKPDSEHGELLLPDGKTIDKHSGLSPLDGELFVDLVELDTKLHKVYLVPIHNHENISGYCLIALAKATLLPSQLLLNNIASKTANAFANSKKFHAAEELVYIDSLTELHNARYLHMVLEQEVKRAERYRSELAFIFMDLDYFKQVNDTYGHLIGSQLLVEFGELLANNIREVDSVYRFGGDEFAMLLVETGKISGVKVADRIRRTIEEHVFCTSEDMKLKVTACLGVAAFPNDTNDSKKMIELADKAMYIGKNTTRNAVNHTGSLEEKE
jgi:diguanylate cyclase (GGDEF)-like protein